MEQVVSKLNRFLFDFETRHVLIFQKMILGFALLNIIILLPDAYDMYSELGYIQSEVNDAYIYNYDPLLKWIIHPLKNLGLSSHHAMLSILLVYVFSLVSALFDYEVLTCSIIAWILHVMMVNSSYHFSYGADYFINFALFFNVVLSIVRLIKNEQIQNTVKSFFFRFLQIQLCFVYFFAGLGKIAGVDWINGDAMWFVLNSYSPEVIRNVMPDLVGFPSIFLLLCWAILTIELLYPIAIFNRRTKRVTLIGVYAMHIGIMVFMQLYTFGAVMILLNIMAFDQDLISYFIRIKKKWGFNLFTPTDPVPQ